jgi:hypothetical protein
MIPTYEVKYKNIIVKMSDGSLIRGKINIANFNRLADYLKQGTDKFITVLSEDPEEASEKVTFVNREYIIWATTGD